MKKTIGYIALLSIMFGVLSVPVFAKSESSVTVKCDDTISGYGAEVEVNTLKNTTISLMLETPAGGKVYLQERSNEDGGLTARLADYHLQRSGDYAISARFGEQNEDFGQKCAFKVYPGDLSTSKSTVNVNRKTAEAGAFENIVAEVKLVDNFGNPIKGHTIELLSSDANDEIQLLSKLPYTDDNGIVSFLVNSEKSGVSTLSAIDLSENVTLDARTKIAFIAPDDIKAIGGMDDFTYDSYFDDASIFLSSIADTGEVFELLIELKDDEGNISEENEIEKNQSASISISAVDELGNIVPNYTGTVRFSATDENANLPEDYIFTSEDLGMHDFDLGFVFKTEGTQTLSVNDINNFTVKGETEFQITPSEILAPDAPDKEVNLTSPVSGTFKNRNVKVAGAAAKNTKIAISDNEIILQESSTDSNGDFEFTLQNLGDGDHAIKVTSFDTTDTILGTSEIINLTLDATPPILESFNLDLTGDIMIETELNASLQSEAGLTSVSLLMDDRIIQLNEDIDMPGKYVGVVKAPATAGKYEIDLVLKDAVGNEGNFMKQLTINVTEEEVIAPTQVSEITAIGSDGRVTLTWAAAEDDTYITNYKISYGPNPEELYFDATTFDSSTTWYIPNLMNGEQNYFGIQGVDSDGNLGIVSELIVAQALAPALELPASLEDPIILEELPKRTPETGPELWFMIIASLLLADIYYNRRKKVST